MVFLILKFHLDHNVIKYMTTQFNKIDGSDEDPHIFSGQDI